MRAAAAAVIWFAIGCATPPAPIAATRPAPPPPPPPPAPVTCAEAGVLLRGSVDDHEVAGPAKEEVIAKACQRDGWPEAVLQCVGSQAQPGSCLDQLTAQQLAAYGQQLGGWNDDYPDEVLDATASGWEPPPPPRVWHCHNSIGDQARYSPPAVAVPEDLRMAATALRMSAIRTQCDGSWGDPVLACLHGGDVAHCLALLEPVQQQGLTAALTAANAVIARMVAAFGRPAAIECRKVVAAHYGDPAWKGKLADRPARDRPKLIAESRAAMTRACSDDSWSAGQRACVVAGGGEVCFTAAGQSPRRWGFPALIAPARTGIPDCDLLLVDLERIARCDGAKDVIGNDYIDAIKQLTAVPGRSAERRRELADQCRRTSEGVNQLAEGVGCP